MEELEYTQPEPADRRELTERARTMEKWVHRLFLLIIPTIISGVMTNEQVTAGMPGLYVPGEVLSIVTVTAYALILLKLEPIQKRYHTAGVCILLTALLSAGMVFISTTGHESLMIFLMIPSTILDYAGMYNEYQAHSAAMQGICEELSKKWKSLWKWVLRILAGFLLGVVLMLIAPSILPLIVMLAVSIGLLVLTVLKLCYLYQTYKACEEYCAS